MHLLPLIHVLHASAGALAAAAADAPSWWDKHPLLKDLLVPDVSWLEKMVRPILVYFFLIISLRVAGKRELAQLNPFDLIVLLTLSNTVQNAIIGNDNSVSGGIVGATTLLAVNYLVVRVVRRNKRLQRLLAGRADVLIWRGQLQEKNLEKELLSKSDLAAAAHKQGIASLKDVERCVLEPTGTITFLEKTPSHDAERHGELVQLLSQLREDMTLLRAQRSGQTGDGKGGDAGNGNPDQAGALRRAETTLRAAEHAATDGAGEGSRPVGQHT